MSGTVAQGVAFLRKLLTLVVRTRRAIQLAAMAIGILSGLATAASVALIHSAIRSSQPPSIRQIATFTGLCLAGPLLRILSQYLLLQQSLESMMYLVLELIGRVLATPLRRLEQVGPDRILTALMRDVPTLTEAVSAVPSIVLQGTILLGCTLYLARLHLAIAALFVVLMTVAMCGMLLAVRQTSDAQRRKHADGAKLVQHFRAHLFGVKELQLHLPRRLDFLAGLRATGDSYRRNDLATELTFTAASSGFQLVLMLGIGVLVLWAAPALGVPPAEVGAYALLLLYMYGPLGATTGLLQSLGRGAAALRDIEEIGLALPAHQPVAATTTASVSPAAPMQAWSRLELVDVVVSYVSEAGDTRFVLGPVNLQFDRGETVFIVGGNGSGKTTLAKVLCGLYVPDRGEVRVDGEPITDQSRENYRQLFSAIFADFHLFPRLHGLQSRSLEADARRQLKILHLHHCTDVRDGAFTTIELSQGQRKRVALLVACLEGRQVYVFDEWAADQDHTFREFFYHQFLPELRDAGSTVFVISHDDRYYHMADRVLKLDLGSVVSDVPNMRTSHPDAAAAREVVARAEAGEHWAGRAAEVQS